MYDRLLVAVDHSEVSGRVLAAAKELATLSKGKVWVLHLREREIIAQMGGVPSEPDTEAHQAVEDGVDALKEAGVDAAGEGRETRFGRAARESVADPQGHKAAATTPATTYRRT